MLILACLSGCISEEPEPTGPINGDVTIDMTSQLTFAPAAAQARVGQTVVWVNTSSMPHTVTADPSLAGNAASVSLPEGAEPFASPLVDAGGSYSRTFTVAGTYRYFCQPHEGAGMIGTIVVAP
ncbi:MAG TPA: plastocyanin/azurin family copper-binding protein [Longimicrobiales bacterium]|nr:plastocyanin/azurin family copper-binding protein [Longimicrobiales bacterium]